MTPFLTGFGDELEKLALKVPVMHGTYKAFPVLARQARKNLANDPNPAAVYFATKKRSATPGIEAFARQAVRAQGEGTPTIAHTKIDTMKGWVPRTLTGTAKKKGVSVEDLRSQIRDVDEGRVPAGRRGEVWRALQEDVGSWANENPDATARVRRYRPASAR